MIKIRIKPLSFFREINTLYNEKNYGGYYDLWNYCITDLWDGTLRDTGFRVVLAVDRRSGILHSQRNFPIHQQTLGVVITTPFVFSPREIFTLFNEKK